MKSLDNIYKLAMIVAIVLCGLLSGCDLDVEPSETIADETFWRTEKDAWYNLNALYAASVPGIGVHSDSYTDDVYCQYPWESSGSIFQQDGLSAANDEGWNFESIRNANTLLINIDKCSMREDLKNRFKAEARFLRAFEYLNMTILFGKVPIITTVLDFNAPNISRNSIEEVQTFILNELTESSNVLPETYQGGYLYEVGRVTKYAVLALKARAALYFGDYPLAEKTAKEVMDNGGYSLFTISTLSESQQKEADEMDQYVDFQQLGIDKDRFVKGMFSYESLWHTEYANPNNPEYIFTRQYAASGWDYQDMTRYTNMRPNQLGGWSSVTPTQNFINAYWTADGKEATPLSVTDRASAYEKIRSDLETFLKEDETKNTIDKFVHQKMESGKYVQYDYIKEFRNRDSRMYVSILFPFKGWYETNYGNNFVYEWRKGGNNESKTGYNFRKAVALDNDPQGGGQATGDYPCIRYAEILLIFAEARTINSGYDGTVQAALNQLRDRCGMPHVPTSLSKQDAIDLIRKERRIELVVEGLRSKDLTRYDDTYWMERMNNVDVTQPDGEVVISMKWNKRMRLRPIPQEAIDSNHLLETDQNLGY